MYEKTNWVKGDKVTAEKLNHAEKGIEDNSTIIIEFYNGEQVGTSYTYEDIENVLNYGGIVMIKTPELSTSGGADQRYYIVVSLWHKTDSFFVTAISANGNSGQYDAISIGSGSKTDPLVWDD